MANYLAQPRTSLPVCNTTTVVVERLYNEQPDHYAVRVGDVQIVVNCPSQASSSATARYGKKGSLPRVLFLRPGQQSMSMQVV